MLNGRAYMNIYGLLTCVGHGIRLLTYVMIQILNSLQNEEAEQGFVNLLQAASKRCNEM